MQGIFHGCAFIPDNKTHVDWHIEKVNNRSANLSHLKHTRMGHEQIGETTTEAGTDEPQVNLLFWQNDHSRLEHLILAMNVTWFPE